jgi:glucokinase
MILVGDIGGTHTRLAIYPEGRGDGPCLAQEHFSSRDFCSVVEILREFCRVHEPLAITRCAVAVAGPVIAERSEPPNLPWHLDSREIASALGLAVDNVSLLNDLEAAALATIDMPSESFQTLQEGAPRPASHRAVIAPGTGLGEAVLYWDGRQHRPLATEGGHCDFAPRNEMEFGLLRHAHRRFADHVSVERILCGAGIALIYDYLRGLRGADGGTTDWAPPAGSEATAAISERALTHQDRLCEQTLSLYLVLLGAEVGNLALKAMALGGIVIAGGVVPKILPAFEGSAFLANVAAKGRFRDLLSDIPISVCLDERAPLLGALKHARGRN